MCPHGMAHWRHLANTIELVFPSVHPSPQLKRQIDQFSGFCTAHGRKSLYFTMGDHFPPKLPLLVGDLDSHLIHDSLSQTESTVQTASRSVQLFSHRWPQSGYRAYTLHWAPLSPKIAPSYGIWTPIQYVVSCAHPIPQPKWHLDQFSRCSKAH